MSMNKPKLGEGATPGPWKWIERLNYIATDDTVICENVGYERSNGKLEITKEQQANARLIAKAPLLVEARDVLTELIDDRDAGVSYNITWDQARVLLAKLEED